jgi:glycosyltransferase involved in cell wall biosynthesis
LIDSSEYYLIASRRQQDENGTQRLKGRIYNLPSEPSLRFGILRIQNIINPLSSFLVRVRNLLVLLHREPVQALIACSGDVVDIPAAFLASRILHIPFYAYIFDDYVYQWTGNRRRFAKFFAPFIFKHSAGIIGPNEYICKEYEQRYGVETTQVRNPCEINELGRKPFYPWPAEAGKIKIFYSGSIYRANYDCFLNLLEAMDILSDYPLELHIFTAQSHVQLLEQGIAGEKIITHTHIPNDEILELQRKADILFLPLAFESPIPEVIRTSAPGKLGEYLASGRPILAHVPDDSFVADYCNSRQCADVVSQNDVTTLAQEIKHIITDMNFRTEIIHRALIQAQDDFHPRLASEKLLQLLEGKSRLD